MSQAAFVPCSGESWRDPFGMYAALRDADPVHHVEHGDYWVLSRYADVEAAAVHPETFSSAQGLTFRYDDMAAAGLDEVRPMVMLDPPGHTAFRRLVARGFTPRHVAAVEPEVRAFVVDRVERLRAAGTGDVVAELAGPLPSFVVGRYLGVPLEDQERFDAWTDGIVAATGQGDPLLAGHTVAELFAYFTELVERRRREPGDDVVSELVAACDAGEGVTPLQVLGFAFTMVTGGNDTTTGLLGGALELLTDRPDQRALLLDDPALLPDAVEELLRLTSPVQGLARTTTCDIELHGVRIPTGRKVLLLFASGNRDPREFGPDAEELDARRRPGRILSFGLGGHHCLGAAAARLMGRVALEELLRRCPSFSVDAAAGRFAAGHFVRRYASLPFTAA
ncbi:MAG: cytochrome P450 [Actinomycetes bacterium]